MHRATSQQEQSRPRLQAQQQLSSLVSPSSSSSSQESSLGKVEQQQKQTEPSLTSQQHKKFSPSSTLLLTSLVPVRSVHSNKVELQQQQQQPIVRKVQNRSKQFNINNNDNKKQPQLHFQQTSSILPTAQPFQTLVSQYLHAQPQPQQPSKTLTLNNLFGGLITSLGLSKIGKRSGKISPLDNALYSLNSIPDSTEANRNSLSVGEQQFNLNNIQAINDMIGSAVNAMGGNAAGLAAIQPQLLNAANQAGVMNQITTYFDKGKRIFEIPKQLYKSIGEKISGASEVAVSASGTVKDSFMSSLKSFYNFLKPSRSSSSPASSLLSVSTFGQAGQGSDGTGNLQQGSAYLKRRQSLDGLSQQQQYSFYNSNQNYGQQPQHQQWTHQQQQQPQQWNNNFVYPRPQQQAQQQHLGLESQHQPQYAYENNFQQQQSLQYGVRVQPTIESIVNTHPKDQTRSSLYKKTKEKLHQIAHRSHFKNTPLSSTTAPSQVPAFPGQYLGPAATQLAANQLSSQTLAKVQNKLGTLPISYNQQQQQQQQQKQGWTQQIPQSQQVQGPSLSSNYFTLQPSSSGYHHGYQSHNQETATSYQGVPIPLHQSQQQGQSQVQGQQVQALQQVVSSTQTPVVTSTSVSMSHSISSSSSNKNNNNQQQLQQSLQQQQQFQSSITVIDDTHSQDIQGDHPLVIDHNHSIEEPIYYYNSGNQNQQQGQEQTHHHQVDQTADESSNEPSVVNGKKK